MSRKYLLKEVLEQGLAIIVPIHPIPVFLEFIWSIEKQESYACISFDKLRAVGVLYSSRIGIVHDLFELFSSVEAISAGNICINYIDVQ